MMVAKIKMVAHRVNVTGMSSGCRTTDWSVGHERKRRVKEDLIIFSLSNKEMGRL